MYEPRRLSSLCLAVLLGAGVAAAQRTWIVDARNGPGTDYTELGPCVGASKDGDTIIVRAGTYRATTINKALGIIGQGAVTVIPGPTLETLKVTGIGAGKRVSVRGITLAHPNRGGLLAEIVLNQGSVHFEEVIVGTLRDAVVGTFKIEDSRAVTLDSCSAVSAKITRSGVMINGGSYVGIAASTVSIWDPWRQQWLCTAFGSLPALEVWDSLIQATQATISGGNGDPGCPNASKILGSPGINVWGPGRLVLSGAQTRVSAGTDQDVVVNGGSGELVIDPRVKLIGRLGHTGFVKVDTSRQPYLSVSGGVLGKTIDVALSSQQGDGYMVFASLPGVPVQIAGFREMWLDPNYLILLGVGVQGKTEVTSFRLSVPNQAVLRGLPVMFQGLSGAAPVAGRFTNAAVSVLTM